MPNRISKYSVLTQLLSFHVWRNMGKGERAEGQESLHTAGGSEDN
jgi:hypothetical protein